MKKDIFVIELIKSGPFRLLIALSLVILTAVYVAKCKEKKVQQMKEDILYVHPKPKV